MKLANPPAEVEIGFLVADAHKDSAKALSQLIVRLISLIVTPLVCFGTMWYIDKEITDRAWQLAGAMAAISAVFLIWSLAAWFRAHREVKDTNKPPIIVTRYGIAQGAIFLPWETISAVTWRRGRLSISSVAVHIRVLTRYLVTKKATLDGILMAMSDGRVGISGVQRPDCSTFSA